jgi:hypothetical protein
VVDPEDCIRRKDRLNGAVEVTGAGQVVAERLLDHDSTPLVRVVGFGQSGACQLLAHDAEELGWDRQVERVVSAGALLIVEGMHRLGQPVECVVVGELTGHEPKAL